MLFPQTERFSVYKPIFIVADDLNVLPTAVSLAGSNVAGNLHRAGKARDAANLAGVIADLPALAYFQPESYPLLSDRGVLVDEAGDAWLIHGKPARRTRFAATAHVVCLCSFLPPGAWPAGLSAT